MSNGDGGGGETFKFLYDIAQLFGAGGGKEKRARSRQIKLNLLLETGRKYGTDSAEYRRAVQQFPNAAKMFRKYLAVLPAQVAGSRIEQRALLGETIFEQARARAPATQKALGALRSRLIKGVPYLGTLATFGPIALQVLQPWLGTLKIPTVSPPRVAPPPKVGPGSVPKPAPRPGPPLKPPISKIPGIPGGSALPQRAPQPRQATTTTTTTAPAPKPVPRKSPWKPPARAPVPKSTVPPLYKVLLGPFVAQLPELLKDIIAIKHAPKERAPSIKFDESPFADSPGPSPQFDTAPLTGFSSGGVSSERCECPPKKKRGKRKTRTVCYAGTYTETSSGLQKRKRRKVPCRPSRKKPSSQRS